MGDDRATLDELGPMDYLVVEFPTGITTFTGEIATELAMLCHEGLIRVLDLLVIQKAADGMVDGYEIEETGITSSPALTGELAEILAAQDVADIAAAMAPGSVAGVVVWENLWAVPLTAAARRDGGQLIATGHIPIEALAASLDADARGD